MRNFILILSMIALSISYDGIARAKTKGPLTGMVKGYRIIQTSEISGELVILVTSKAARIVNRKAGYKIVMKAPDWHVWVFNDTKKIIYKTSWKKFNLDYDYGSSVLRQARYSESGDRVVFGKETLHGHRTEHIRAKTKGKKNGGFLNVCQFDCWIVDKTLIPLPVAHVIQKLYRIPSFNGYPLKFTYTTANKKTHMDVTTKAVSRQQFKKRRFAIPSNYKTVSKLSKIMLDMDDASNMIETLLGK